MFHQFAGACFLEVVAVCCWVVRAVIQWCGIIVVVAIVTIVLAHGWLQIEAAVKRVVGGGRERMLGLFGNRS